MNEILYLVVPCYNEQEVLPETAKRLDKKLSGMVAGGLVSEKSRVLLVDDGSRDTTWQLIEQLHKENPRFCGVKLSRNQGHQNALVAGLMAAKDYADITISLDADLQDDVDAIDRFVQEYQSGAEVVYGVRSSRKTDTAFKRNTAVWYYGIMKKLGVDIVHNHADYRLLSKRALDALVQFGEVNLFLRGIVPLIGFHTAVVEYERHERFAGESKYPLKKMLAFAGDGITSFSVKPLRFILWLGVLICALSGLMLLALLVLRLAGHFVSGVFAAAMSIWLLGGILLTCMGIVGEYIGKIYKEVKHRPRYIIDQFLHDSE